MLLAKGDLDFLMKIHTVPSHFPREAFRCLLRCLAPQNYVAKRRSHLIERAIERKTYSSLQSKRQMNKEGQEEEALIRHNLRFTLRQKPAVPYIATDFDRRGH